MNAKKRQELYSWLIHYYGVKDQSIVAIEELSELQKEITKYYRGKARLAKFYEEIADAEIMIEQLRFILNTQLTEASDLEIDKIKRQKLEKLYDEMKELGYRSIK